MGHGLRPLTAALTLGLCIALAPPGAALDLTFPAPAQKTAERIEPHAGLRLPTGPFASGTLPTRLAEGAVTLTAFRLVLDQGSTLTVMQALQDQLAAAGHKLLFSCETDACGGYDFRYGAEVLPEPDMHVNLGDFRYLLAEGAKGDLVALLVSRSSRVGFVQIAQVGGAGGLTAATVAPLAAPTDQPPEAPSPQPGGLTAGLDLGLSQVLEDLVFPSGSSALAAGDYASLQVLAEWLAQDATRKLVLVGHTDASGSLEGNINLSRLRAESVRQKLLYAYNISPDRIQAEGIGYLSPRASNLTEDGRRKNRRVEAMATSTLLLAP